MSGPRRQHSSRRANKHKKPPRARGRSAPAPSEVLDRRYRLTMVRTKLVPPNTWDPPEQKQDFNPAPLPPHDMLIQDQELIGRLYLPMSRKSAH
eukprot:7312271-Pyramimonas_sp.AAC.1